MQFNYEKLYNDVYNIWLMKCISGNIGFNQECYKHTFDFAHIEDFAPTVMYPNDDLDIQLAWLDLLIDKGIKFTGNELLQKFIDCYQFDFSEYGYCKRNYKRGIVAPHSGNYNNYFAECMGCPIRAEVWGIVSAGNPALASFLASQDGSIDHNGNSVEAEKLIACMVSLGFSIKDIDTLFSKALEFIDHDCAVYKIVNYVRDEVKKGTSSSDIVKYLYKHYAKPDGTSIIINMGFFTLGLYVGGSDFDKVMTTTLNCGFDTDCTCASAGSIYGLVYGLDNVDKKWIDMAGEDIVTATKNIHNDLSTFTKLTKHSLNIISSLNKVEGDTITINDKLTGYHKDIQIEFDYIDGYEIKDAPIDVLIKITNNTNSVVSGNVSFDHEDNINLSCDTNELTINANECATIKATISNNDKVFSSDKNVIYVNYLDTKEMFGVVGSQAWRIVGPYFEGFDWSKIDDIDALPDDRVRVWGGKKYLFHMDVLEYTNNWVRFDYEYINEDFNAHFNEYFDKGDKYFTTNDFIKLDDIYSVTGPMVAYAFQKLHMNSERVVEFHLGSSDPYKIWVNGKEVTRQEDNWYFSPYNQRPRVLLHKGENQIVIKIVRKGESQKIAYVLRDEPYNHVGAIAVDSKYVK